MKAADRVCTARTHTGFECKKGRLKQFSSFQTTFCQILLAAAQCQP